MKGTLEGKRGDFILSPFHSHFFQPSAYISINRALSEIEIEKRGRRGENTLFFPLSLLLPLLVHRHLLLFLLPLLPLLLLLGPTLIDSITRNVLQPLYPIFTGDDIFSPMESISDLSDLSHGSKVQRGAQNG